MLIKSYPKMIQIVSNLGYSPLHFMMLTDWEIGVYESITLLLDHYPELANKVDKMGCTALHYMVRNPGDDGRKKLPVVEFILSRMEMNAICAVNGEGKSAMDIAREFNFPNAEYVIGKKIQTEKEKTEADQN